MMISHRRDGGAAANDTSTRLRTCLADESTGCYITDMETLRILIDPPLSGAENMGRDECLLGGFETEPTMPVLRLYAWSPATISLGYFQEIEEFESLDPPIRDLSVVRRTTGGGAILHDLEVTYSLSMPLDHPLIHGRPNRLYELAHDAVIRAVGGGVRLFGAGPASCGESSQRGPFFCFERRHALDVVVEDPNGPGGASKLAGSSQRRTRRAVLQHGSIMLDSRFPQQPVAFWKQIDRGIDFEKAATTLVRSFGESLGLSPEESAWREDELDSAHRHAARYAGKEWTRQRRK